MARLKVGISELNTVELIQKGNTVHLKLTDNAAVFPAPVVSLVTFKDAIDNLNDAYEASKTNRDLIPLRKQNEQIVRTMINQLAAYVASVSMGDPVKFVLGGFDEVDPATPAGELPPVEHFKVNFKTGFTTELFLSWKKLRGAHSYIIKMSTNATSGFQTIACVTQCRYTAQSLTPGTVYYFTCTPVGAEGEGGVSPVESCIAV